MDVWKEGWSRALVVGSQTHQNISRTHRNISRTHQNIPDPPEHILDPSEYIPRTSTKMGNLLRFAFCTTVHETVSWIFKAKHSSTAQRRHGKFKQVSSHK